MGAVVGGLGGRLAVAALALGVGAGASGAAAARAHTTPPSLSVAQRNVTAGGTLRASVTPAHRARGTRMAFYLSSRASRARGALALGTRLVRARGGHAAAVKLHMPRVGPVAGHLIACPIKPRGRCLAAPGEIAVLARPHPARARPLPAAGAQTATIGVDGGSVSAVTPAGVHVTLTLPEGALSASTPITLTPLRSLGTAVPGRLRAAATIAPARLRLGRAATVSFSAPGTAGLGFGAGGENLHLVPARHGAVTIGALGGVGEIVTTAQRMRAFALAYTAADPLSQLEQLVAAYGSARGRSARAAAVGGSRDSRATPDIVAYVVGTANVIEAEAPVAFPSALATYQVWLPLVQGLSGEYPGLAALELQVRSALVSGGLQAADRDGYRCQQLDLGQIPELQTIAGAGASLPSSTLQAEASRQIADCLQFDITVDSQLHHNPVFDGDQTLDFHYQAKAALDYDHVSSGATNVQVNGSGDGKFASATVSSTSTSQCPLGSSLKTTTVTMPSTDGGTLTATLAIPIPAAPGIPVSAATLTLYSDETETYLFHTTGDPACAGDLTATVGNWWTQVSVGELETGDATMSSDGDSIVTELQQPTPEQSAPTSGLLVYKQIPADPDLFDSGTATVQVIQDPGHVRLPNLAPAG